MSGEKQGKGIQERLARFLELPDDVIYDLPKVTLIGDTQFYIENHRGIIAYSTDSVRIAVSIGQVEVRGEMLTIRTISRDELYLDGRIQFLCYTR